MNHRATTTTKPYCRACHNAGKPIDEYTSHWTRSSPGSGGVITCPLILSSECGYCHQAGHWTKFCPILAGREAEGPGCEVEEAGADDVASVDSGMSKSKKVLNWKSTLGMKAVEAEAEPEVEGAGENSTRVLNWKKALGMGEAPVLLPPPPPTSTTKMSKEEFKRIFCNFIPLNNSNGTKSRLNYSGDLPSEDLTTGLCPVSNLRRFKRYENWADADSDLDDDDDMPVGSLAV